MNKRFNPKKPLAIATTGIAHGNKIVDLSESLLSDMAASYDPTLYAAPLVKGHPKKDEPRYGTVKALTFSEEHLLADTEKVDAEFVKDVNGGAYPYISLSAWEPTHPANPRPGSYYLKHVGFLGAVPPAIKGQTPARFELAEGEHEDGIITFAFDTYSQSTVARLFRSLRDLLIDKHGQEVADRVIPDYAVEQLTTDAHKNSGDQSPEFSETETTEESTVTEEEKQALENENASLKKKLAAKEQQDRNSAHVEFCEGLVKDGKLLPAHKDITVAVLNTLQDGDNATIEFGEGDDSEPLYKAYKTSLADADPIDFSEVATGAQARSRSGEDDPLLADAAARANN